MRYISVSHPLHLSLLTDCLTNVTEFLVIGIIIVCYALQVHPASQSTCWVASSNHDDEKMGLKFLGRMEYLPRLLFWYEPCSVRATETSLKGQLVKWNMFANKPTTRTLWTFDNTELLFRISTTKSRSKVTSTSPEFKNNDFY